MIARQMLLYCLAKTNEFVCEYHQDFKEFLREFFGSSFGSSFGSPSGFSRSDLGS